MSKSWKIIARPVLETILNNHAQRPLHAQPLILHGPRGVGKTTLLLDRCIEKWNQDPHATAYVDFAESMQEHHPLHNASYPWSSWSTCPPLPPLSSCVNQLENSLESLLYKAIRLGSVSSHQIFSTLSKWHRLDTALLRIIDSSSTTRKRVSDGSSSSFLWDRAVFALSVRSNAPEIEKILDRGKSLSVEEESYFKEAVVALRLAKQVVKLQQKWRSKAIMHLNRTGGFSRSLANSCTDWPCLLIELLSQAAEIDYFQPKLILNNIEVLKNAVLTDDTMVSASMYHDSLIWRIIALGANERCMPVLLATSDSYYSYQVFVDFGFPDLFISRETFGWTPQEAKMHMVPDYFCSSEWSMIVEVLGPNSRHLFELYALKQSNYNQKVLNDKGSSFEDVIDAYLAYLQVTVVNPAMDKVLLLLQKFVDDAQEGKIPKERLYFGAPWRHPPQSNDTALKLDWARLQLMDFVQAFASTEFGVNYLFDPSFEIFDDPCTTALLEVGLLYSQRDPSFIRPISRGIQRCLVRWLVQECLNLSFRSLLKYNWHRVIRGRSYRHLMQEVGYK